MVEYESKSFVRPVIARFVAHGLPGAHGRMVYAADPGDILDEKRQRELETLTDRVTEWEPDRIAVEETVSQQPVVDDTYAAYREDPDTPSTVSGWERDRSNETVQVGVRLADELGHDSVAAVDYI